MKPVVTNASPLIALAKIDRFYLLAQLFEEVWMPDAVWEEVVVRGASRPAAELIVSAQRKEWIQRQSIADTLAATVLQAKIGAGEDELRSHGFWLGKRVYQAILGER